MSLVSDGVVLLAAFQQIIFNADSPILWNGFRSLFRSYPRIRRGVPSAGGHFAQKSELRAHQMARICGVPASLRKKSELSSHQMAHPGQLRTKIRAETSSNGSEVRGAGFTPHQNPRPDLMDLWTWPSGTVSPQPMGVPAVPLREGGLRLDSGSTLLPSASRRFVFLSWHAVGIYFYSRIFYSIGRMIMAVYCRHGCITVVGTGRMDGNPTF